MEKIGYALLSAAALGWLLIVMWESTLEFWPHGLLGLLAIIGFGFLFVKALSDRLSSKEDDHYSKNVDK